MKKITKEEQNNWDFNQIAFDVLSKNSALSLLITYYDLRDENDEKSMHFKKRIKEEIVPLISELFSQKIQIKALNDKWPEEKIKDMLDRVPNYIDPSDEFLLEQRNEVDIGCPCCGTRLVFMGRERFQTLSEHVMSPNEPVTKKNSFGCPNEYCAAHKEKILWLEDGDGPYSSWNKKIKYIDDNNAPFRTYHRRLNAEKEKRIRVFRTKHIMIYMNISSKADENGKRHWNKKIKFELSFSKDGMGYIKYISGLHMFIFVMKKYMNKEIRQKEIKEDLECISWRGKEWWRKLPLFIASIVWKKDYKAAKEKMN